MKMYFLLFLVEMVIFQLAMLGYWRVYIYILHLELQTTSFKWMEMVKKNISFVKIWNHAIETTIYRWMFQVAGIYVYIYMHVSYVAFGTLEHLSHVKS